MKELFAFMQPKLQAIFDGIVASQKIADRKLTAEISIYETEFYLLRAYVAILKPFGDNEFTISVGVQEADGRLSIEFELALDDGSIGLSGPEMEFPARDWRAAQPKIEKFLTGFEAFLAAKNPVITDAISRLK